jgi:hypothetical protein
MDAANPLAIKESQTLFTEKVSNIFGNAELPISDFTDSAKYQNDFDKALSLLENFVVAENEFQTEAKANLYFKNIKDFLIIVSGAKKSAIDKFLGLKKKQDLELIKWKNFPPVAPIDNFLDFLTFVIFTLIVYDRWDKAHGDEQTIMLFLFSFGIAVLFSIGVKIIAWVLLYFPYKTWGKNKKIEIESKQYELPTWLKFIDAKVNGINDLVDSTLNEVLTEIKRKKDIQHKDDLLGVEDKYNEKISNRNLSERLATITAELQAAKERAKDLQDEHRLTEELRVKYAREMKEIERQSINDGNNDLMQKVDILNNLLGSK